MPCVLRSLAAVLIVSSNLLAGHAEASEVVKLARLVVNVKRNPVEQARVAPDARSEASRGNAATSMNGSGGTDATGTAPVQHRGVS